MMKDLAFVHAGAAAQVWQTGHIAFVLQVEVMKVSGIWILCTSAGQMTQHEIFIA
jgi:hypothetical protein